MNTVNKLILSILLLVCLAGCREKIVHNLSERDANTLLTRLDDIAIKSEKIKQPDGKWTLSVPQSKAVQAIRFLSDTRLLREPVVLKKSNSMISSPEERGRSFERALSGSIESTLMVIEGVLEARVHLNLPPRDPFFGRPEKIGNAGTGSVLLIVTDAFPMTKDQIVQLVAGASGISADGMRVEIVDSEKGAASASGGSAGFLDQVSVQKHSKQNNWPALMNKLRSQDGLMIQAALSFLVLGIGGLYFTFFKTSNFKGRLNNLTAELQKNREAV